jgi:uncharacterized cofD-like protein
MSSTKAIEENLANLDNLIRSPLDLLPYQEIAEKFIYLELQGPPEGLPTKITTALGSLAAALTDFNVQNTKVVVLGGGTGLSNIIGGDSRKENWPEEPFSGLKEVFPQTKSIVCVTDDGGSTGELLKDLPFIALGDLRHVMLSSIRQLSLQKTYGLDKIKCLQVAETLHELFNYRFASHPESYEKLIAASGIDFDTLPEPMREYLTGLLKSLFTDPGLAKLLARPHCLGNLLLAAAVWQDNAELQQKVEISELCRIASYNDYNGLKRLSRILGLEETAVMPCALTPAKLQLFYGDGTLVTGEYKSSHARRGYPVDRLLVSFAEEPRVPEELIENLQQADIIVLAPGSLYTSTIPIFQVPGLAEAIRKNKKALKILTANLWVQKGETDVVREDPKRRFYVSDLIRAYQRNIPGGVKGLFSHVLSLGLQNIPSSILQNYAMEDKIPIYLDRENLGHLGFKTIEAGFYSQQALLERNVIQHDPAMFARSVRTLYVANLLKYNNKYQDYFTEFTDKLLPKSLSLKQPLMQKDKLYPCERYTAFKKWLAGVNIDSCAGGREEIADRILKILWFHQDILLGHLSNIKAIIILDRETWSRSQEWDNIYSFYDPTDRKIKICQDVIGEKKDHFELAFLVALGQSILGNYAAEKRMQPVKINDENLGKMYRLTVRPSNERKTFLTDQELTDYLKLARMIKSKVNPLQYTRLVNGNEGFTPPGLLFGLIYAWYLDNRLAAHVEYKMSIMKTDISDLIPEQVRVHSRRRALVNFFRQAVFCHSSFSFEANSLLS